MKSLTLISKRFLFLNDSLTNENGETFRYGYQDGKRGVWVKEVDTDVFVPFKSIPTFILSESHSTSYTKTIDCSIGDIFVITVFTYSNGKNQQVSVSNTTTEYEKVPESASRQMREMIVTATSTSITIKITVTDGWGGITVSKM